ncbi:MAG: dienelactone hydrolase family protein [Chloroflexota bacterium]
MGMITLENGQAYLALPEAKQGVEQGAGVLLLHAWWGLTDFFKATADRMAEEGFVVLAPDLYHGATAKTIEEAQHLNQIYESDADAMIAQIDGAIDFLTVHPAVSSDGLGLVGFSMGANWGLYTAHHQPEAIAVLVVFYGTYNGNLSEMRAAFQGHFAENDDFESREGVEQLEQTLTGMGLEANVFFYEGTGHWFFEADRPAYHPESARLSWEWMVKFLHEKLDTPT